ncbi:alcohol dehydrogenase-like 4 isoform X2 [Salvia hispanica]|uniref:alcohol dehydrogenase-like 4 isoform X2 n=1 Tax=Salvia hispanica TaxID=49212 RepID=UPI0020096CE2|nr:alcohol dehydrogenase-like 4 isoform X2 [Salvia hispanica]
MGSNGNKDSISNDTIGKVITCKAAVAYGPGQALVVEDIRVDPPQKMELRIRVLFTSVCHTDLTYWRGQDEAQRIYPRIFGHEASGVVESVGEGVSDLEIGDHVVPIFNGECGKCVYCNSSKTNLCEKFRVDTAKSTMANDRKCRFSTKEGKPIFHFLNTSTFSEYTVVDSACVVKVDREASLNKMSLLSCGVSTGVGAVWNTADVEEGSTVAVFGLGAVGLAVVEGARSRGASRIIGVDVNPHKSSKAQAIGITDFINPMELDKPTHQRIREMTEGGVDYSFECAGNLDVLREAFLSTHDGWGLTVILGVHPTPRLLPLHPMELFEGRRIVASVFGDFKGKSQLPHLANQCIKGVVKLDEFITHEMPFSRINEAMQLLSDGTSLRCLLHL